jgi:nucleoside-diphosphate-sugar epimerase
MKERVILKVLFIGGTGLISQAVSKMAVDKGIELYLFNRGQHNEFIPDGAHVIYGDIRSSKSAEEALAGYHFDTVVNWIAFTPDHIQADLELFRGKTNQYIYISSASVYQKPPVHYLVTESTPLSNPFWQYSRDKIACENLLMEEHRNNGFPVTIVRPSFTYGKSMIPAALNSWEHSWSLVDRMLQGKKIIVHGDGSSLWTITHNTDFAKGFIGLLGNLQTIGHAFHITSDEVLNWNQFYTVIGRAAGVEPNLIHIPTDFITSLANIEMLRGDHAHTQIMDNSKIKRFVPDYVATVSFSEGIRQSIDWFEANPERCTIDHEWNATMDKIIATYER